MQLWWRFGWNFSDCSYGSHWSLLGFTCAIVIALAPGRVNAEEMQACSKRIMQAAKKELSIDAKSKVRSVACQRWMNDELVSIAYEPLGYVADDNVIVKLGIMDEKSGNMKARYEMSVPDGGGESVVQGSLRLDTRALLSRDGVLGFGLKIVAQNSVGCAEGGSDGQVMLFRLQGGNLSPLFNEPLTTHYFKYIEGAACTEPRRLDELSVEISMGKNSTNGVRDLELTFIRSGRAPTSGLVKWDGVRYPVEKINAVLRGF